MILIQPSTTYFDKAWEISYNGETRNDNFLDILNMIFNFNWINSGSTLPFTLSTFTTAAALTSKITIRQIRLLQYSIDMFYFAAVGPNVTNVAGLLSLLIKVIISYLFDIILCLFSAFAALAPFPVANGFSLDYVQQACWV